MLLFRPRRSAAHTSRSETCFPDKRIGRRAGRLGVWVGSAGALGCSSADHALSWVHALFPGSAAGLGLMQPLSFILNRRTPSPPFRPPGATRSARAALQSQRHLGRARAHRRPSHPATGSSRETQIPGRRSESGTAAPAPASSLRASLSVTGRDVGRASARWSGGTGGPPRFVDSQPLRGQVKGDVPQGEGHTQALLCCWFVGCQGALCPGVLVPTEAEGRKHWVLQSHTVE